MRDDNAGSDDVCQRSRTYAAYIHVTGCRPLRITIEERESDCGGTQERSPAPPTPPIDAQVRHRSRTEFLRSRAGNIDNNR